MMVSNLCIALLLTGCILPPIPLNLGDHAPNTASPSQAISSNVELVEQVPGPALTVAVQGDYAYLGFSFNVAVIDVSDPTNPHVAASLLLSANDLVIADNKLYVAGRDGLFVVDITAPTAPTVLGQLTVDETLTAVAVKGAYVYLIHHHDLLVIDASNPAFLQQIARVTMAHRIEKITIAGDHAYLSGSKGIDIVDISGPHQPALISHIPSSTSVYGPVVVGDFAYFIQDQQLFTLDVSDPATPQVIAQSSMPGLYGQFVLVGSLAYVANLGRGLEIFDLAAPDNVQPLGAYRSRSYALDLVIKGDHAYVALLDEGLNIIDIGNPTAPELVGNLLRLGPVYDVASAQGKLYCIAGWDGLLHQWNLQASPCLPAEICHVSSTAIFDFVVQDHLIYAIDPRGLLVIDVADATVPTTLATYPLADAWSLALADHTVYISGRSGTVTAIDVHDPAQPQLLATYADLGFVRAMVFAGDYAYLPRGEGEIAILAVAPTGELTALGSFQLDSTIHDITIVGATAYVATLRGGLTVLDLHDPTAPRVVSTFATPGDARDFVAHGALGYLADGAGGLRVIDIRDPTQLREVGYYLTPDSAQAVTYVDGLLYVADTCGGLVILRYSSSGAVSNFPY